MNNELEKIDLLRERTGVSYREAKKALDEAGGDVVQALINLEEGGKSFEEEENVFTGKKQVFGHELMENIKDILQRGQATKIRIKQGDRTVLEVPASVGAVGLLGALISSEIALLGVLGSIAAMSKKYTLEFDRPPKKEDKKEGSMLNEENRDTFTYKSDQLQ